MRNEPSRTSCQTARDDNNEHARGIGEDTLSVDADEGGLRPFRVAQENVADSVLEDIGTVGNSDDAMGDQMTIDEISDLLARELPEGYSVKLTLENGYGTIDVEQWLEADYDMEEFNEGSIEDRLLAALAACKAHAEASK